MDEVRLGDLNALKKHFKECANDSRASEDYDSANAYYDCFLIAGHAPTITGYKKEVHGRWIEVDDGVDIGDGKHMECSVCGTWKQDRVKTNYCPHCSATMDLEG